MAQRGCQGREGKKRKGLEQKDRGEEKKKNDARGPGSKRRLEHLSWPQANLPFGSKGVPPQEEKRSVEAQEKEKNMKD